jgi:hypothetical protein
MLYVLSIYLVFLPPFVRGLLGFSDYRNPEVYFILLLLQSFTSPSQGFFTVLIYVRPRYLTRRNRHPEEPRWKSLRIVLKGDTGGEASSRPLSSTAGDNISRVSGYIRQHLNLPSSLQVRGMRRTSSNTNASTPSDEASGFGRLRARLSSALFGGRMDSRSSETTKPPIRSTDNGESSHGGDSGRDRESTTNGALEAGAIESSPAENRQTKSVHFQESIDLSDAIKDGGDPSFKDGGLDDDNEEEFSMEYTDIEGDPFAS